MRRRDLLAHSPLALAALAGRAGSQPALHSFQSYFPPPDGQGGWRTLRSPGDVRKFAGIDVSELDQAFEYTKKTSRFGGLLVVRHGYLVYEQYFGRASREVTPNMASCGKMFTSVCLGILSKLNPAAFPDGLDQKVFTLKYLRKLSL